MTGVYRVARSPSLHTHLPAIEGDDIGDDPADKDELQAGQPASMEGLPLQGALRAATHLKPRHENVRQEPARRPSRVRPPARGHHAEDGRGDEDERNLHTVM